MQKTPLVKLSRRDRKTLRRQWRLLAQGAEVITPHPFLHDAEVKLFLEDEAKTLRSGKVGRKGDWRKPVTGVTRTVARSDHAGGYFGTHHVFCKHAADNPVIRLREGTNLFAGARPDTLYPHREWALIIDLAGMMGEPDYSGPAAYDSLRAFVGSKASPTISLDWQDYGLPPVTFNFWPELARLLPTGDILVRCYGGHGRTGTALAALLIVAWDYDADTAIATVRKHHCNKAVESVNQKQYLRELARWHFDKQGLPAPIEKPETVVDMKTLPAPALSTTTTLAGDWLCDECSEYFLTLKDCVAHGEKAHAMTLPDAVKNALYDATLPSVAELSNGAYAG